MKIDLHCHYSPHEYLRELEAAGRLRPSDSTAAGAFGLPTGLQIGVLVRYDTEFGLLTHI